ncbi:MULTISPECIES: exosortase system-associated protein, TIGR04073 family [Methylococcus]|uniref:Exosortase system-associated protein, TIGR04073 family n=1 Tax=Methylococcus capsulatus TaxID=414 RepID=A0ABZ2FAU7_METCP|nr:MULTISPECIES: exosortase system-associated protein, TIGR04073 family [Methylococcus]MDF9391265.1 exosortase system-associated protein, TIGR04073 family [Methylococcus capsulatus]
MPNKPLSVPTLLLLAGMAAAVPSAQADDYGATTTLKLGSGLSNLTLGWLEIPKSMINTSNQTNVLFGISGGLFKGLLHTVGRTLTGAVDFLTFPVPTQPITHPEFVWQKFSDETSYGPAFTSGILSDPKPAPAPAAPPYSKM